MTSKGERMVALQARMGEMGVGLAAFGPTANMTYLLGFAPHSDERVCLLLVSQDKALMVTPGLNAQEIASHTDVEMLKWEDADGPERALGSALNGIKPAGRVAVDGGMRADFLLHLQAALDGVTFTPADMLISPLRSRKSAQEIEMLARAAAQADRAMQAGMNACRPGATENEVAWAVESAFRQDGAQSVEFTLIAAGSNGAYPHHHSSARQLREGDAIILDIGATLDGYQSDITRMVYLGKPTEEFLQAYNAVLDANQRARAAVRPGVAAGEIDRAARSTLEAAGYGEYFTHRTGHGLGLEGHEAPWIMSGDQTVLEEGNVFSIEPGVYLEGQFGVRIEDIVAVTADGARDLTGSDHALVIKS